MGMRTNALFLITLTCGTILVVLLSIVISTGSAKPKQVPSVMYFAIYLGDEEDGVQSCGPAATSERKNCSFHLNVNNTRSSILFIQNRNQQYSFILYDENARSTPPLKALDAIALLTTIEPIPGRFFNQTSAIEEFARQGSVEDKLVHYIPCRYDYSYRKNILKRGQGQRAVPGSDGAIWSSRKNNACFKYTFCRNCCSSLQPQSAIRRWRRNEHCRTNSEFWRSFIDNTVGYTYSDLLFDDWDSLC
ncbi:hypothetical protein Y032_0193g1403 [Ancylostoma ceylanicum]|nr:hypothetical protein Y032_0193g1403 [Ancylostoma ceylanicum]